MVIATQPQFASMNYMTVICPNPIVMLQLFVYHLHLASQIHDFVDWERINPDGQV